MDVDGLVLFPGAGSGADHPSLLVIEEAVAPLPVSRVDFAYRSEGRRFPDRTQADRRGGGCGQSSGRAMGHRPVAAGDRRSVDGWAHGIDGSGRRGREGCRAGAGLLPLHPPKSPKPSAQPILRPSQCPPCSSRGISMRSVRRRSCGGRRVGERPGERRVGGGWSPRAETKGRQCRCGRSDRHMADLLTC